MIRPVSGGCWGEARFYLRLRTQGAFQWHGTPDPVSVETCSCAQTYSQRGISACVRSRLGTCNAVHRSLWGRNAVCRCSLPCVGRVDGGTTGRILARTAPRLPPETRSAKEAKETDRLWWKTPRLSCGGRRGIAVRTKWQSGSASGNVASERRRGNRLHRQRGVRSGEIQPGPKP